MIVLIMIIVINSNTSAIHKSIYTALYVQTNRMTVSIISQVKFTVHSLKQQSVFQHIYRVLSFQNFFSVLKS